jgi:Domain of unknown function (DUF4124)
MGARPGTLIAMTPRPPSVLLALAFLAACSLAVGPAAAEPKSPVYKWTDEKGAVHYGDAVPPQYSDQEKTLLNAQGVAVGTIPGRRTPAQIEAETTRHTAEELEHQTIIQGRQRDQNLLATYLSVEEIESLRDRRAEILDAQARVTSQYLEQLRTHQRQLERQVQRFQPYNPSPSAAFLPERIAEDLVRTTMDILTQQKNLEIKRQELDKLRAQFASDIARFKEMKKSASDYGPRK